MQQSHDREWTLDLRLPTGVSRAQIERMQRIIDLYLAGKTTGDIVGHVDVKEAAVFRTLGLARRRWVAFPRRRPYGGWVTAPDRPFELRPVDVANYRTSSRNNARAFDGSLVFTQAPDRRSKRRR